jgi:hypothetical protein
VQRFEPIRVTPPRAVAVSPVPQRDAKLLEVLIGQMAENRRINIVFGKALRVLGHVKFFEPVRNLLHGGHQGPVRVMGRDLLIAGHLVITMVIPQLGQVLS